MLLSSQKNGIDDECLATTKYKTEISNCQTVSVDGIDITLKTSSEYADTPGKNIFSAKH